MIDEQRFMHVIIIYYRREPILIESRKYILLSKCFYIDNSRTNTLFLLGTYFNAIDNVICNVLRETLSKIQSMFDIC